MRVFRAIAGVGDTSSAQLAESTVRTSHRTEYELRTAIAVGSEWHHEDYLRTEQIETSVVHSSRLCSNRLKMMHFGIGAFTGFLSVFFARPFVLPFHYRQSVGEAAVGGAGHFSHFVYVHRYITTFRMPRPICSMNDPCFVCMSRKRIWRMRNSVFVHTICSAGMFTNCCICCNCD